MYYCLTNVHPSLHCLQDFQASKATALLCNLNISSGVCTRLPLHETSLYSNAGNNSAFHMLRNYVIENTKICSIKQLRNIMATEKDIVNS
jgi:hypothetical protein